MSQRLIRPGYRERHVDHRLEAMLETFGAVELTGPKWCGKTWTGFAHATSAERLDDQETYNRVILAPETALLGSQPRLIDEWQEVPSVWDEVRRAVDDSGSRPGQFILTGSTRPKIVDEGREEEDLPGKQVHHSGTGRIKRLRMWPMTLAEQGESSATTSLAALFDGEFEPSRRETSLDEVARWCCRGGWPVNLGKSDEAAFETSLAYLESVYEVSIPSMRLSPATAQSLVEAIAVNLAQSPTKETLALDMAGGGASTLPAASTIDRYLDALRRLFLVDDLPGWEPPLRAKARVRVRPKRYFADPSLAAATLGATPKALMRDTQTLGNLFETLVIRDLNAFCATYRGLGTRLGYYRDQYGLEVDAVVEKDGRWGAIEIKLSSAKIDDAVKNLLRLRERVAGNPAARNTEPAFLAVVVGRGDMAYRRSDGIYVIPAATLTA